MDEIIEKVEAYKFEGKLYETKSEINKILNLRKIEELVEDNYYRGIDENGIVGIIVSNKEYLSTLLNEI